MITKEEIFNKLSDFELCALTIYGEARGESIKGQIAIMNVIKNRKTPGHTYKDVVTKPKQFSCWNDNDPNLPILIELGEKELWGEAVDSPIMSQIKVIVDNVMSGEEIDNTNGSNHYLVTALKNGPNCPIWAKNISGVEIGNHTFIRVA